MDVDAVLARAPQVAMIDELAHTNVPGSQRQALAGRPRPSRRRHRRGDDRERAAPGVAERRRRRDHGRQAARDGAGPRGARARPDPARRPRAGGPATAARARQRLPRPSRSTPPSRNYFRVGNLTALRELALLWLADRVDDALTPTGATTTSSRRGPPASGSSSRSRADPRATRCSGARPGSPSAAPAASCWPCTCPHRRADGAPPGLARRQRALVESLGGTFHTVVGDDVPQRVLDFARGVNATRSSSG